MHQCAYRTRTLTCDSATMPHVSYMYDIFEKLENIDILDICPVYNFKNIDSFNFSKVSKYLPSRLSKLCDHRSNCGFLRFVLPDLCGLQVVIIIICMHTHVAVTAV